MTTKNLLVELFVEELPPKALKKLGEVFAQTLAQHLKNSGLSGLTAEVTAFASPRRLAAHVTEVAAVAADKPVVQKLMPVAVGLDAAGNATPALLKKLAALGADASCVPNLRRENDGKADILFYDSMAKGATLAEGLQKAIEAALAALPIPKVMTYQLQDGWSSVNFVRPAHSLVALHGDEILPVSVLGLNAGRETHGHRFEARIDPVVLADADEYAARLATDGAVIASFADRRAEIVRQLEAAAAQAGAQAHTLTGAPSARTRSSAAMPVSSPFRAGSPSEGCPCRAPRKRLNSSTSTAAKTISLTSSSCESFSTMGHQV